MPIKVVKVAKKWILWNERKNSYVFRILEMLEFHELGSKAKNIEKMQQGSHKQTFMIEAQLDDLCFIKKLVRREVKRRSGAAWIDEKEKEFIPKE